MLEKYAHVRVNENRDSSCQQNRVCAQSRRWLRFSLFDLFERPEVFICRFLTTQPNRLQQCLDVFACSMYPCAVALPNVSVLVALLAAEHYYWYCQRKQDHRPLI